LIEIVVHRTSIPTAQFAAFSNINARSPNLIVRSPAGETVERQPSAGTILAISFSVNAKHAAVSA
jgi:hypothetical protein